MGFPIKISIFLWFSWDKNSDIWALATGFCHEAVADVGDAVPTVPPLPDALPTAGEVRGTDGYAAAGEGNDMNYPLVI